MVDGNPETIENNEPYQNKKFRHHSAFVFLQSHIVDVMGEKDIAMKKSLYDLQVSVQETMHWMHVFPFLLPVYLQPYSIPMH